MDEESFEMLTSQIGLSRRLIAVFCGAVLCSATTPLQAEVRWSTDIEGSLKAANAQQRLVLMKFTATWCGPCKRMEKETFGDPAVANLVNQSFVPVLVDGDKHKDLVKHLQVVGFPSILVVSPEMIILHREKGYKTAKELMPALQKLVVQHQSKSGQRMAMAPATNAATARPVSQTRPSPQVPQVVKPSFEGLCLPAVFKTRGLVKGTPQFSLQYRGKTLYFSSAEHMQEFKTNTSKYWPSRDGLCPVTLAEEGRRVEGKLQYAAMFRGKLWLTSDAEKMKRFVILPARFVDALPQ